MMAVLEQIQAWEAGQPGAYLERLEQRLYGLLVKSLLEGQPASLELELSLSWSLYLWRATTLQPAHKKARLLAWSGWLSGLLELEGLHPSAKASLESWIRYGRFLLEQPT